MTFDTQFGIGEIIAVISLVVSAVVLIRTRRFGELQNSVLETQKKLNELEILKHEDSKRQASNCCFVLNMIKIGKNYRLKVFNKGPAVATNFNIMVLDGNDLIQQSTVDSKLPITLKAGQNVEISASPRLVGSTKARLRLVWENEAGQDESDEFEVTI